MRKTDEKLEQLQQDFKVFYDDNLRQIYELLEPTRRIYLKMFWNRVLFTTAVILLLWGLCHFDFISSSFYESEGFTIIGTIAAIIDVLWIGFPFTCYHSNVKHKVMKKLLSFWGNFEYFNNRKIINYFNLRQSELFPYFNKEEVDDSFCGIYKDTSLAVSEHNLRIHGSKGDVIMFKGVFILLKFNKSFKGNTLLLSKWRWLEFILYNPIFWIVMLPIVFAIATIPFKTVGVHAIWLFCAVFLGAISPIVMVFLLFAVIYRIYRHFNPKKATKKVLLEGIPFLRKWRVYTDDQVEARYILTPVLMEKMLKIKKLFHGNFIDFSFFGHNLLIAVHTHKDLFETTSFFRSALRYRKVREVVNQLYSIFSVVDILDFKDMPSESLSKKKKTGKKKGTIQDASK